MSPMNFSRHPLDEQLHAGLYGDFETGWKIAQELAKATPECHRAAFNRAWYEMHRGDLLKGLELLDRGRWIKVFGDSPLPTTKPIYRNENLQDKKILLVSEGGLGDEIINIRFARDFAERGAHVTASCDPGLMSVFARVPGVSSVINHYGAPHIFHDFWVPAMSAAHVLGYSFSRLTGAPYLRVDDLVAQKWWDEYFCRFSANERPRIGLRFYGNPQFEHEQFRRFPREDLVRAVGSLPWVNLQKEETSLNFETWEDTLAVISHLDLVITSCTSVAHAAAALGKETWIIVPLLPYYLWALPGTASPWYRSVRLFRQTRYQQWDDVFQELTEALKIRFSQSTNALSSSQKKDCYET